MRVSSRSGMLRTSRGISVAILLIASVGCGSTQGASDEPGASGGRFSGTGGAHGGNPGTAASGGQLIVPDESGRSVSMTSPNCSSDLRSVVDDKGAITEECPADQGCANGTCVEACAAAAKSRGSVGCEFFALDTPGTNNGQTELTQAGEGLCYAMFVANGWNRPAKLKVSRAGQELDVSAFARIPRGSGKQVQYEALPASGLPANEVAVLFLSHKLPLAPAVQVGAFCPVTPAIEEDAAIFGTGRGAAFHIISDTPLSAYDISTYGGAAISVPSATLLLPAPTWGTNYIAIAPASVRGPSQTAGALSGRLWTTVVAQEDETTIRLSPSVPFPGGASGAAAPVGAVTEYKLHAGEAIQWQQTLPDTALESPDPSGSVFESEKPFGLWTGNTQLSVASATSSTIAGDA
ncbi:MAG TPA: hypothetical protein VGC79_17060, partial [Polyangiaceae bacterium]